MCYRIPNTPENRKKALTKPFTPREKVWTSKGDPETDLRRTWTKVQVQKNVKMLSALKTREEKPQLS